MEEEEEEEGEEEEEEEELYMKANALLFSDWETFRTEIC